MMSESERTQGELLPQGNSKDPEAGGSWACDESQEALKKAEEVRL